MESGVQTGKASSRKNDVNAPQEHELHKGRDPVSFTVVYRPLAQVLMYRRCSINVRDSQSREGGSRNGVQKEGRIQ